MLDQQSMKFMENLINSFGPSGFEREPARIVRNYVSQYVGDFTTDKLGAVLFKKQGTKANPIVLPP